MFNIFNKKTLTSLGNFDTQYEMDIKSQTYNPQEKEPLEFNSKIKIVLSQKILKTQILNTISSKILNQEVSDPKFLRFINNAAIVSDIINQIKIERSNSGKFLKLTNKKQIIDTWNSWRKNNIDNYFPILEDQEKFIEMMNSSLPMIEDNIKNEFQYLILSPECFHFKNYVSTVSPTYTSTYSYTSKLLSCPEFEYKLKPIKIEESNETITLILRSFWINETFTKEWLKGILPNLSFTIFVKYCLDKTTGRIIDARLKSEEFIEENTKNIVHIKLV